MEESYGVETDILSGDVGIKCVLAKMATHGAPVKLVSKPGLISFFLEEDESIACHISIKEEEIIDLDSISFEGEALRFKLIKK